MWMLFLFIRILCITCVCGYEHEDYNPSKVETEVAVVEDITLKVSSVDELLEWMYPEYGLVRQCLRKKAESTAPHHYMDDHMWGASRQEASFKTDGTLEVIIEEIQRTICRPREVCLEVSKEFPDSTSRFFVPRCVAAHRCGGCCSSEAWHCTNTSYTVINKTLMEPRERSVVMVPIVNHTSCECQPKRPRHSIIRRSLDGQPTLCPQPDEPCSAGLVWYELGCECVPVNLLPLLDQELEPADSALLALCGPNKVLDEESCECACQNGLTAAKCGPGLRLDEDLCECVCEMPPDTQMSCPPNQSWDPELCACACQTQCPLSQPLDQDTCLCQCRESEHTCLLQGKRFRADTCSCYRLPCKDPHKKCQNDQYYSHLVCQCIPKFLRSRERELT
ncbi:hypothetical protein ACEWY4_009933 [Coilia grayii]|uniref:Platelet-derived growth factor (PDGF) family profile domain-containing protein n=1 Tax=Coilia grayii TaxID=363190 RepID=A0ABD1K803_9TELE